MLARIMYHEIDGMKCETLVVSLDAPKPQLIFEKACPQLEGVTTAELVVLQARGEGDLSTLYKCALKNSTFDADQFYNSSYELKMLHGRLSLMRINSDGLLLIMVLIGGRAREVVVHPLPCVSKLLKQCTDKVIKA